MNKNPFSIYDFLGYLFPGFLTLIIFCYFYQLGWDIYRIIDISNTKILIDLGSQMTWEGSVLIIVIAYAIGHLISYLSSITLETLFTNKIFGYPSTYLFDKNNKSWKGYYVAYFASDSEYGKHCKFLVVPKMLLKGLVLFSILPVALLLTPIGTITGINSFIVRPLDDYLRESLISKQTELALRLKLKKPDHNCDFHRIIMHYVYLNIPASQSKTNNYLALYGFLRCLSFIACITFDVLAVLSFCTISFSATISFRIIFALCLLILIAFVFYLAFVKFYRRFTLENLMTLLVGLPNDTSSYAECLKKEESAHFEADATNAAVSPMKKD